MAEKKHAVQYLHSMKWPLTPSLNAKNKEIQKIMWREWGASSQWKLTILLAEKWAIHGPLRAQTDKAITFLYLFPKWETSNISLQTSHCWVLTLSSHGPWISWPSFLLFQWSEWTCCQIWFDPSHNVFFLIYQLLIK